METLSKSQMAALRKSGAKVTVDKPKPKPKPAQAPKVAPIQPKLDKAQAEALENQTMAFQALASQLGSGQMMLAEKMITMVRDNQKKTKPTPYRFIIQRNKRGLIETVDAHPIIDEE